MAKVSGVEAFKQMFGEKLMKGKDELNTADALDLGNKKAVAIYFSAHWCPPCRGFTPKLAEWYKSNLQEKGMEVVFASSDRDEESFNDYYGEQPWLALPFSAKDQKAALSKKFKIQGIPSLVILDAEGAVITLDGRGAVSGDPTGEEFPWTPKPLKELIGTDFLGKDGLVGPEAIAGKTLGIYFSAHWCPPCRNFTPMLTKVYNKLKADNKNFELVFASSDRDEASFNEYYGEMPWLAVPFSDRKRKDNLSRHFGCSGIPMLVILDAEREVISANAVSKVRNDTEDGNEGSSFPWAPDMIKEVNEDPEGIDEGPSLVVLHENKTKEEQEANLAILKPIVEKYKALAKKEGGDQEFNFFHSTKSEGQLGKRVRSECSVKGDFGIVMMDIPDNGGYYSFEDELTEASVEAFFSKYRNKELTKKQMGGEEE